MKQTTGLSWMSVLYRRYRYNPTRPITPPVTATIVPPWPPMIRPSPTAAAPTPIIATFLLSPLLECSIGRAGPGKLAAACLVKPAGAMRGPAADAAWAVSTEAAVGLSDI